MDELNSPTVIGSAAVSAAKMMVRSTRRSYARGTLGGLPTNQHRAKATAIGGSIGLPVDRFANGDESVNTADLLHDPKGIKIYLRTTPDPTDAAKGRTESRSSSSRVFERLA